MIDPFKPVKFNDDRSKRESLVMRKMVFLDSHVCLCLAYTEDETVPAVPRQDDYVLFDLASGYVMTSSLEFFYATN